MTKKTDVTKVTISQGHIVRFWSVNDQMWTRRTANSIPASELAAMTPEARARVIKAQGK